jgi:hypothetical protein
MTLIDERNDRGSRMTTSTLDSDGKTDSLEAADNKSANNQEGQVASRRYMDAINSLGQTLNLERRDSRRERRIGRVAQYTGPARREIIDRRENPGDRRKRRSQS